MPSIDDLDKQVPALGEQRLRQIIDAAPNGMLMVNQNGQIVLVNSQIEHLFQYNREELVGMSIEMLVPQAAREKHPSYRDGFFHEPKARAMGVGRDLFGLRKDGSQIPVEIGLNPLIADGETFVLASVVDITERKRSEERLRLIVEAAPSGMIMVDESGKIVLVNSQVERLFNYSREELLGQSIDMLVPSAVRAKHPEHRASFFADPKARAMGIGRDLYGQRKDGTQIPVEIGLNPLMTEGERFVLASIVDITERKRSEERLRLVVEAAPSGMIMVDESGKIVLVNSQVERLFDYSREELLGQSIDMLVPSAVRAKHPEHRASFFADPKARAMGIGRDLYGQRKDGTQIPVEIGLNPLMTEGERFVLASIVDITERKRAEALLQENLLELQRSNEDLQQFAYVCSHDLQEPLRVISNYTQLLAKRYTGRVLDESANEFIEFTVDATKRMQELINDLLLYSRVQTKGQEFKDTDCSTVVELAVANLKLAIQESAAKVHCDPLPTIKGDSSQLVQLFQNLVSNAIKFRSKQPPEIYIYAEDTGTTWTITVRDNGQGFDMKYASRIFIIFQRLHTKEMYPGSGIGLAVCKKIVERHGGRMWVESEPEKGSSFHFTLPRSSRQGDRV